MSEEETAKEKGKRLREEHGKFGALRQVASESVVADKMEEQKRKAMDDPTRIECRQCRSELQSADVGRCPHCGYDPSSHKSKQTKYAVLAGLFTVTIIGIPVAAIFIVKARKHGIKARKGVAIKHYSHTK